jgi:hypothetical protein
MPMRILTTSENESKREREQESKREGEGEINELQHSRALQHLHAMTLCATAAAAAG